MLPMVNLNEYFIVTEEAHTTLGEDWLAYIETLMDKAFDEKDNKFKTIKDAVGTRGSLFALSEKAKDYLGIGKKFSVIDIHILGNKMEVKPLVSYEELINQYFAFKNVKVHGMVVRSIIDRFFGFQWSRGKLLYPITRVPYNYQRPENWMEMLRDSELSSMLETWFVQKGKTSLAVNYRRQAVNGILSSTRWLKADQITDPDLSLAQDAISSKTIRTKDHHIKKEPTNVYGTTYRRTHEFQVLVINELRYMLIDSGRDDIRKPRDIAKEKKGSNYDDEGNLLNRFGWIDTTKHPNLIPIVQYAEGFLARLKREGLAVGTISSYTSYVNGFIRYLIEHYPYDEITVEKVDEMFDHKSDRNLIDYTEKKYSNKRAAHTTIYAYARFLTHCELYSATARKNTPVWKQGKKLKPHRDAMPRQMVADIVDIIKNRPPKSTTKWSRDKADASWWKHDVYPVYPMMMLFGYYIPTRGEQIRNLCRDNSFVFNARGAIETFVINTDKNVNRKYMQEIPCVWEDLQEFVPFLKWHKEYFNHLPKVKYKQDPNSPWEDITPLMITPQSLRPMSRQTHAAYHKKILCRYQLEKMAEAKKRGDNDYPIVAWNKKNKPFFKNMRELDKAGSDKMNEIGVTYDIHSLRVTGATRYLESGVGLATVMDLTGHMSSETLMRVYINLTRDEKIQKLRSAVDKIYFGAKEDLLENTSDLIKGELTRAYQKGKENMETAFEDNALFSMNRKASYTEETHKLQKGVEVAQEKHPTSWIPMVHGICPAVKCPEGRENKCSLCPYLITGKLFINGVVHQTNLAFARFQRESLELQDEESKGYMNQSRMEGLETILEEILGWQQILDEIEVMINEEDETFNDGNGSLMESKAKSIFGSEALATDLVYLKNAYDAKLIGVEQDRFGLKILTIKAMRLAVERADKNLFDIVSGDETKSIDMLMQYYTNEVESKKNVKEFITSVGILPKPS